MRYIYRSRVGTFCITPISQTRWGLFIEQNCLGQYPSAIAAADDVYTHTTGYMPWDLLDGKIMDAPTDIYQWDYYPV